MFKIDFDSFDKNYLKDGIQQYICTPLDNRGHPITQDRYIVWGESSDDARRWVINHAQNWDRSHSWNIREYGK